MHFPIVYLSDYNHVAKCTWTSHLFCCISSLCKATLTLAFIQAGAGFIPKTCPPSANTRQILKKIIDLAETTKVLFFIWCNPLYSTQCAKCLEIMGERNCTGIELAERRGSFSTTTFAKKGTSAQDYKLSQVHSAIWDWQNTVWVFGGKWVLDRKMNK